MGIIIPSDEEFTGPSDDAGTEKIGRHVDELRGLDMTYFRKTGFSPRRVYRNTLKNVHAQSQMNERAATAYATNCTMAQLNLLDAVL